MSLLQELTSLGTIRMRACQPRAHPHVALKRRVECKPAPDEDELAASPSDWSSDGSEPSVGSPSSDEPVARYSKPARRRTSQPNRFRLPFNFEYERMPLPEAPQQFAWMADALDTPMDQWEEPEVPFLGW
jgi:hypothetical protein